MQISFLLQNCEYESTGFDVYDLYGMDQQSKYEVIIRTVENLRNPTLQVPNLRFEKLTLDLERLRQLQVTHHIPEVDATELRKWRNSVAVKTIIATATSVFTDVVSQKIALTGDDGECCIITLNSLFMAHLWHI